MPDLYVLKLSGGKTVRCVNIDEAKVKANSDLDQKFKPSLDIIPEGGGPMLTLEFNRLTQDWISKS